MDTADKFWLSKQTTKEIDYADKVGLWSTSSGRRTAIRCALLEGYMRGIKTTVKEMKKGVHHGRQF